MVHDNLKILLVYPQYPETFWSFKHALKFISKKAAFPPLGLLTIASMLPDTWEKKVIDMNIYPLTDKDIKWIMKENLKKARLTRMDAKWVSKCLAKLNR